MKNTISVLVENHFGVLAHVPGLFSARGFNIDSLAVGETEKPDCSRMTIVTIGDDRVVEQIVKQLRKLIDVIEVSDLSQEDFVERDLSLILVGAPARKRQEIFQLIEIFRAKIVDVGAQDMVIEISGPEAKIEAMLDLLQPYGIKEMVRTGRIAMIRGNKK